MANIKPYIGEDGKVRELDAHFFKNATRGRPPIPASARKKRVTLMLDPDVIDALKALGNMSASANDILRKKLGLG